MPFPGLGTSLNDIIAQTAAGKGGGGEGAGMPPAFGEAGGGGRPGAAGEDQQQAQDAQDSQDTLAPLENYLEAGPETLDPTMQFELQQRNLATAASFAGNPRSANNMGPSTSQAVRMHANKLWANAQNWDRYLNTLRLAAELNRLGIGDPHQESAYERLNREYEEKQKTGGGKTPSGYNPNPDVPANQPAGQKSETPAGMGMAQF